MSPLVLSTANAAPLLKTRYGALLDPMMHNLTRQPCKASGDLALHDGRITPPFGDRCEEALVVVDHPSGGETFPCAARTAHAVPAPYHVYGTRHLWHVRN